MRARVAFIPAALLSTAGILSQDPPEKIVTLCDPGKAPNCSEDTLEVTFDGGSDDSDSVFQYDAFTKGSVLDTSIVMDTRSPQVQGWSYGVDHDAAFLTLTSVTIDGTAAEIALKGGFVATSMENIQRCTNPLDPKCAVVEPAKSYISAVLLSITEFRELEVQRNRICKATYTLDADPGPNGTRIFITSRLKRQGSPPVQITLSAGKSLTPSTLVDGWVRRAGEILVEDCKNEKDDDADGQVDCADRDCSSAPHCVPVPEVCDNEKDDDLDGLTDCKDPQCFQAPPCLPPVEICDNGKDDDDDARVDCDDADCEFFTKCRRENCNNEFDDNGDGAVDCDDKQCEGAVLCVPEICDNGIDDNRDAMTDCYDPDCESFPACEPKAEICDNDMDDDFDGKIDCSDQDCKSAPGCEPVPEICDNREDDDRDGRTDCRDADCNGTEACAPKPEICDNCFDDDRDGSMDCRDSECLQHPFCAPKPEICDNFIDDDDDGDVDADDSDCWLPSPLPLGICERYALYCGPAATAEDHAIVGETFAVSLRNLSPVLFFRLTLTRDETAGVATYTVTGDSLEPTGPSRRLEVLNDWRTLQEPAAANRATGLPGDTIIGVERGSAIAGFAGGDFLSFDIAPDVRRGPCLVADYVTDLNLADPRWVIPPTGHGIPCPVNEILRVQVGARPAATFRRGELDGVDGLGVTDALLILHQFIFGVETRFDCEDILDVDDDGVINLTDPIVILRYQFQGGPSPVEPFDACGLDSTPDPLSECLDSNCR